MGYDINRFTEGEIDELLICIICSSVLEDPLQSPICEHAFCASCIKNWLAEHNTCPIDRRSLSTEELKPASRILRNLLSRLNIICDNAQFGCKQIIKLEQLSVHRNDCEFNPKRPIKCSKGCGLVIPKDEMPEHNCIKDLRTYFDEEMKKMDQKYCELKECFNSLKDVIQRISSFDFSGSTQLSQQLKVPFWCYSLRRAKVLRWGGLISTPDSGLQTSVKKSLLDSGYPLAIVNELMENSHERKWPPGLSSLEIRQMNRQMFNNYVCRKVNGHQAVVVFSFENQHMNDDMILEPGLIMIFAHGINYSVN